MRKLRKFVVKNAFKGFLPRETDHEIVFELMRPLKTNEFLVKTSYISVDPYMRSFADDLEVPYDQFGFQVGKVIESNNAEFPIDSFVVSHSGWRDYVVLDGSVDEMFGIRPYKPEIGNLPLSLSVGALGMPGITAYLGLLEICKPKHDEIVCITSAAGAVGSLVGQIAKLKGCRVIGFTGNDRKVQMLKQELGFDYAFNYKTCSDIKDTLMCIAPLGIDIFFDNVGGALAASIVGCMSEKGRVAECGAISTYGKKFSRSTIRNARVSVDVETFSFTQWDWSKQTAALEQLKDWIQSGSIKAKETITNGFEELPATLVGMLKGEKIGKAVVKV